MINKFIEKTNSLVNVSNPLIISNSFHTSPEKRFYCVNTEESEYKIKKS